MIKNGRNGMLVELNPDEIAKAILCLYHDEELRKQISENNLQDIAKFDWDHVAKQYIEVYKELSRERA